MNADKAEMALREVLLIAKILAFDERDTYCVRCKHHHKGYRPSKRWALQWDFCPKCKVRHSQWVDTKLRLKNAIVDFIEATK